MTDMSVNLEAGVGIEPTQPEGYLRLASECLTTQPARHVFLGLDAPVGLEPTSPGPKPDVLPLNEGAVAPRQGLEPLSFRIQSAAAGPAS